MRIEEIERKLRACFERDPAGVVAVYLFGSAARGGAGSRSDVDVAVLFRESPPGTLEHPSIRLAGELERRLGRAVEVVVLNDAPADLVHRVLRDGRLILERDRSLRIQFEVKARNAFFDLQPVLRVYRRTGGGRS